MNYLLNLTGVAPWVSVQGPPAAVGQSFTLTGTGTVAGRPGVDCRFTGTIQQRVGKRGYELSGIYRMGNTAPPYQLPDGPIEYSVTGVRE